MCRIAWFQNKYRLIGSDVNHHIMYMNNFIVKATVIYYSACLQLDRNWKRISFIIAF